MNASRHILGRGWSNVLGHPRLIRGLLWGAIALYVLTFGIITVLKHEAFQTTAFDLGIMDQAIWNTSQGRILQVTIQPGVNIRLAGHVEPILLVISLFYLLYSDPRILLVLQTIIVALGALPIYWLAKERLNSDLAALVFPFAFLLFPSLEAANMFDFHGVTLAATFLAFAFYFAKREGGKGWFLTFMILTMSCREDMALLAVMMGLYLILKWRDVGEQGCFKSPLSFDGKNLRLGVLTLIVGASWAFVALFLVPSHFSASGQHSQWNRYDYLGRSPLEMLGTLLLRPGIVLQHLLTKENLSYLLGLLSPVAFLSLLAPQTLLLCLPTLLMNLLSTYAPMHTLGPFHYAAPLAPFFIISSIYGTALLAKILAPRVRIAELRVVHGISCLILLSSLAAHYYQGSSPLASDFEIPPVTAHERLAERFLNLIPAAAAVSAQSRLVPHLSQRERIYMFPCIEDAEYVFFDVTAGSWPIHPNDQKRLFDTLLGEEGFGILAAKDGYILLQRGLPDAQTLPQEFYDFARVKNPQIRYPVTVDFGGLLRFLGFDLQEEEGMTSLVLYWQPLVPSGEDHRIYPFFYDEEGRIIEDTTLRPMTVAIWHPTSLWREGEVVRMETLPWEVGEDYYIGLGVVKGQEWESREERLMAEVRSSPLVVTTFDEGTAVRLLKVRDGFPQPIWRSFQAPEVPNKLQATLGGSVLILGYNLTPPTLHPGDRLSLTLYWQALGEVEKDYTVFVHLLDGGERIWGQRDSFPLGGLRPTTTWVEGEYLIDEYGFSVQPDAPPGEYLIEVGMYDASNGERLPIYEMDGERLPGDRVLLGTVEVTR